MKTRQERFCVMEGGNVAELWTFVFCRCGVEISFLPMCRPYREVNRAQHFLCMITFSKTTSRPMSLQHSLIPTSHDLSFLLTNDLESLHTFTPPYPTAPPHPNSNLHYLRGDTMGAPPRSISHATPSLQAQFPTRRFPR